jgi:hypothetical protein
MPSAKNLVPDWLRSTFTAALMSAATLCIFLAARSLAIQEAARNVARGLAARPEVENWISPQAGLEPLGNLMGVIAVVSCAAIVILFARIWTRTTRQGASIQSRTH